MDRGPCQASRPSAAPRTVRARGQEKGRSHRQPARGCPVLPEPFHASPENRSRGRPGRTHSCLVLRNGGSLLCCDISEEWTAIGVRAWKESGLADRIELRLGPALQTLRALPDEAVLDLVFIDADKTGYAGYWQELVPRVRPGGVLLVDNVLWRGHRPGRHR